MLTHPVRRAIAACASVLLVLGLVSLGSSPSQADDVTTYEVKGTLEDANGVDQVGISVNYYRASGELDEPWVLEASQITGSYGKYAAQLPAGTYRIMFNEFDDRTSAWTKWRPTPWTKQVDGATLTEFTLGPGLTVNYTWNILQPREGTVSGTITTSLGTPAAGVSVATYAATDTPGQALRVVKTASDGTYSIRVPISPVKIYVAASGRLVPRWVGAGPTFADATIFNLADAESSSGNDAVVTYVPPALVTGRVLDPVGKPVVHAAITFYKSADGIGAPWVYVNQGTNTRGPSEVPPDRVGTFSQELEPGRYRIKIVPSNEDGELLREEYYGNATTIDTAESVDQVGAAQTLPDITLDYSGGLITGRVTDIFNKPLANITVTSELSTGSDGYEMAETLTDSTGAYTIRGGAGPVDLRFSTSAHLYDYLLADVTAPADQTIVAPDVQMLPKPITLASTPTVTGTLRAGETLKTTGGSWYPSNVTKRYQWYYLKSGTIRTISGATRSYIGLHSTDYGKRFRVRVTASYPGVASKVVTSAWSRPLLRNSSVSISGSSPSRGKVKLYATVNASGAKATGRVRFTCATPAAVFASKTVTLSSEKASATFYNLPKSKMTCRATYGGTSTIKSSSRSKTIYVK